jgi:cell division septation protein DedD
MVQQERRSFSRKTLNPLPYISLAPDSGGLVLDVSEQGLRFRATGPLQPSGPIHFSFSAHSNLIEGVADLVWNDPANKTGGLRFTELSDGARAMIRKWPHESDLQLSIGQDFMLQMPPRDESWHLGARLRGAFEAVPRFVSSCSARFGSAMLDPFQVGRKERTATLSKSPFKERKRALLVASSITVAIILVFTLSYIHHREVGEWLVQLGTRIAGEGQQQAVTQPPAPTVSLQPSVAGEMPGNESQAAGAPERAAPRPENAATHAVSNASGSGPSLPPPLAAKARHLSPTARGTELVVQVAALKQEADARELADSLRHKNFQAFVRTAPDDALYRVMLGPYANKAAARSAVDELKKAGFASFVRREPGGELSGSLRIATP